MENLSAYELAQQRIEQRQRKQNHTLWWLLVAIACIPLSLLTDGCTLLIAIIAGVFAVFSGVEWYFSSTRGIPPLLRVKQEMAWLFGESWEDNTGVHEYALALDRIRKRRMAQIQFIFHLIFFLVANSIIISLIIKNLTYVPHSRSALILIVPAIWLAVLVYHAVHAFPTAGRLEQREREAGEKIRYEIEQMQPAKRKNKLKRDVYYVLGDDGELVEVDPEAIEDEKPKRRLHTDADEVS